MTNFEFFVRGFIYVLMAGCFVFLLIETLVAFERIGRMHAKMFQPSTNQQTNTMTAQELINLLARAPEMQVVIESGNNEPVPLRINQVSLNNEAKAWVIWVPKQQD